MAYNVYQNDELIAEGIENKEYAAEGLKPNTEYSFSVSEVIGDKESERSEPIIVITKFSDVASVVVSPKTNNLEVGATRNLTASVEPSTAKQDVSWSSSDEGIATVSNGTITAIAAGTATITVTAEGVSDTATVVVVQPVESVTIAPKTATLEIGETQQLATTVSPSNASNSSVSYESSATGVASVNSSGLVTAIAAGTATITVTTTDGNKTDTSVITVSAPEPEPEPEEPPEEPTDPEAGEG